MVEVSDMEDRVADSLLLELSQRGLGDDEDFVRKVIARTEALEVTTSEGHQWLLWDVSITMSFLVVGMLVIRQHPVAAPYFIACLGIGIFYHLFAPALRRLRANYRNTSFVQMRLWVDQAIALVFSVAVVVVLRGMP